MGKTVLADVIVPSVFEQYALERTAEVSAFVQSGIVARAPEFDALASRGGQMVEMPFWQDLVAGRQILSDSEPLTLNKITASKDTARIHNDAQAWGVNFLAQALAGSDPMQAIVELVGNHWARVDQAFVVACLKGIFAADSMAANLLSIASESIAAASAGTRLNGTTFIDACLKLGDCADRLTAVAMHSATEAALRKLDLIDFIPGSQGEPVLRQFQGRRVVVDDKLPVRAGETDGQVFTTYLFGTGAFAQGAAALTEPVDGGRGSQGVEIMRDALASDSGLINRRRYILHPRGVRFLSESVEGQSPTDEELADGENWERVFEAKNVRIVAIEHNN